MMLYLTSIKRPDIEFSIYKCAQFTHNTKASHGEAVNRIFWYIHSTNDKGVVFNPSKIMAVY